jgi:RHS repeat-associated protein
MKKHTILLLILITFKGFTQTINTNRNSVVERVPRIASTTVSNSYIDVATSTQYLDGLGRPTQKNNYRFSPDGTQDNIVDNAVYDNYGRLIKSYLPTPNSYSGQYLSNTQTPAQSFYESDARPFAENVYENSPLNRTIKTYGAGNAWYTANKSIQTNFGTAGGIRRYGINYTTNPRTIEIIGTHPTNSLYKTVVTNERNIETIEYRDSEGHLIEKDVQNGSDFIKTAYVYDDFGRLAYIIQPKSYDMNAGFDEDALAFKEGVFANRYDKRGRIVEKHTPSTGWTYFIYNSLDQVILSQNARQRQKTNKEWDFKKYDALGREIFAGILLDNRSRADLQALANNAVNETRGTTLLGYTNNQFPTVSESNVKSVNYYDEYGSWLPSNLFFHIDSAYHAQYYNVQGLNTGTKYRSTETEQWLVSVNYYGSKNRVIQQFQENHLNGLTRKDIQYSFTGEILTERIYTRTSIDTVFRKTEFQYDHVGRITKVFYTANNKKVEMANYLYDAIGRLDKKKIQPNRQYQVVYDPDFIIRPSNPSSNTIDKARRAIILNSGTNISPANQNTYLAYINQSQDGIADALQTLNYAYNIRGYLRCLNCINNNPKLDSTQNDLFSMKWVFQEDNRYYDGNISELSWVSKANKYQPRKYLNDYDDVNRLTKSKYSRVGSNENYSLNSVEYDKNSNIKKLVRYGAINVNTTGQALNYGKIDSLSYEYETLFSNRVKNITDYVSNNINVDDFRDSTSITDYTYLDDGSLISDKNKRINEIIYNYLGLTEEIKLTNNRWVRFYYDTYGNKIKKINSEGKITHYIGDIIYSGVSSSIKLYQFSHPEGRAVSHPTEAKTYLLEYQYSDHLGNLRLSFRDSIANPVGGIYRPPVVTQEIHSDPFGLPLKHIGFSLQTNTDKHTFGNHEQQDDFGLGLFDMQTRMYDPTRGQFDATDLSADNYHSYSPFVYAGNNPMAITDPDGRDWYLPLLGNGLFGMPIWFDKTGDIPGFKHLGGDNYLFNGGWLNEAVVKPEPYKEPFAESIKTQGDNFRKQKDWFFLQKDFSEQDKQNHVRQTVTEGYLIRDRIVHQNTGIVISEQRRWTGAAAPDFGTSMLVGEGVVLAVKGIGLVAGRVAVKETAEKTNYVYRAMTKSNAETYAKGEGLLAKNANGSWSLEDHLIKGSSPKSFLNDPWIATTSDISIARAFSSGNGIVRINLSKLPSSTVVQRGWLSLPRTSAGYHYSIWQQEFSILGQIPQNAVKLMK